MLFMLYIRALNMQAIRLVCLRFFSYLHLVLFTISITYRKFGERHVRGWAVGSRRMQNEAACFSTGFQNCNITPLSLSSEFWFVKSCIYSVLTQPCVFYWKLLAGTDNWVRRFSDAFGDLHIPVTSALPEWDQLQQFARQSVSSGLLQYICRRLPCDNEGECVIDPSNSVGFYCRCRSEFYGYRCQYC